MTTAGERLNGAVIGVDVGGTKIAASVFDRDLNPVLDCSMPTPPAAQPGALMGIERGSAQHHSVLAAGRDALMHAVISLCMDLMAKTSGVEAIGIGMAGQIDTVRGVVLDANENLVGAKGTPVAETISAACDLPTRVDNDVRVMALAELMRGAARGYEHVLCLTVGTGIGGALIQHGRVWHGAHFCAGEIGYLYAGSGHTIESLYAGPGIARRYNEQHGTALTLVQMAEQAAAGHSPCAEAIAASARDLAHVLAPVIALIDPQAVVIGGGVAEIGPLWWDSLKSTLRTVAIPAIRNLPIIPAAFGAQAGVMGAGVLAAQHIGYLK